eukprot:CAMPEP_0113461460 /NCGR_PEP_ID=MMETSP0014_2-20120614/11554_1 /TAXON_ID=2857 /ORGANISM="Nitzschia sp." /LENGTH=51 /DNA_ID=CAMNT_0000353225 /DNA_START=87 /DNA_END=239 /DNA_ORIENTATION=+ /assembly_acc=CAM_ASM_000159
MTMMKLMSSLPRTGASILSRTTSKQATAIRSSSTAATCIDLEDKFGAHNYH